MATPVFITGFEHQVPISLSVNGGGLFNQTVGSEVTIDNTVAHTGSASLKIATTGSASSNVRKTIAAGNRIVVLSGYIRLGTGGFPSATTIFFGIQSATGSTFSGIDLTTAGVIRCRTGAGATAVTSSVTMVANQWYLIDLRINLSGTTWTVDWAIDGVAQTQVSEGGNTADDIGSVRIGTNTSATTVTGWVDDVIASVTSGDYPIGAHGVEIIKPTADGTHNAGVNVMEDQAGNDLGTAWSLVDDIPMTTATQYIRQVANGTGNYVEVVFGNMQSSLSSIIGAMAILAYTSETTSANNGGCIVSKDAFSTQTVLHGVAGTLADYSDGSTSNVFYKTAIVAGADTLSEVDAITARMGYSGDATPDPYWINIAVEVAYVPSDPTTIDLDKVSFTSTVQDITIVENEIILLDLVSYTSSPKDLTILENELILLDLVPYSISPKDITILENEVISLNLVSYSSSIPDLTIIDVEIVHLDLVSYSYVGKDIVILENEIVALDLVSYSSTVNDISIVEMELVSLDLASYSSVINELTILESETISLDLVSFSSLVKDIIIQESENISLDLVSYSSVVPDVTILEEDIVGLDSVSYSSVIHDITILESEIISLDLVSYSSVIRDIAILESEIISLDLVAYSSVVNDLLVLESSIIVLDLVSYSSLVNDLSILESEVIQLTLVTYNSLVLDISVIEPDLVIVITPIGRCYAILEERRIFEIESENRINEINFEERTVSIN